MKASGTDPGNTIFERYDELRDRLKSFVFDQDRAVDDPVDGLVRLAYRPLEGPALALFTFLGPPLSGKKFLARSLAALLDGPPAFKEFDKEQYGDPESAIGLLVQQALLNLLTGRPVDSGLDCSQLIAEYWDQVKGLAELLIRREIVDGAELVRITEEKPGGGDGGAHG